jgi:hypothetical protein
MIASFACKLVLSCALLVAAALVVSAAVPPGSKLLARSEFHWDNDGWKGYSKRRVVRVEVDMGQVPCELQLHIRTPQFKSIILSPIFYFLLFYRSFARPTTTTAFGFSPPRRRFLATRANRSEVPLALICPSLPLSAPLCHSPYLTQARCRSPSATASTTALASALKKSAI